MLARDLNRDVFIVVCIAFIFSCTADILKRVMCSNCLQDLRNHGHSAHDPEHNYTVMAEDVENFIHQHGLEKAVLFGHSM